MVSGILLTFCRLVAIFFSRRLGRLEGLAGVAKSFSLRRWLDLAARCGGLGVVMLLRLNALRKSW